MQRIEYNPRRVVQPRVNCAEEKGTAVQKTMQKKRLNTLIKIAVTLAALVIVWQQVDFSAIGRALLQARWGWVAVGFVLFNLSLFVRGFRWFLLLRGIGSRIRLARLIALYFVGNFFNIALPSGFGGDVVRAVEAARDVDGSVAAGTVILDRLTGLVMLFVMAVVVMPFQLVDYPAGLRWITIGGGSGGVVGLLVLLEGSLIRALGGWLPGPLKPVGDTPVARLLQAVQACGWPAIGGALAASVLFNLMLAGWWAAAGRALDVSAPFRYYVLIMPLVSVPLLIPSVSGLGPRELIVPTLFAGIGVSAETAVSISLLIFAITRLSGLLGAPLYLATLLRRDKAPANTATDSVETI